MNYLIITASFLMFSYAAFQWLRYIDGKVNKNDITTHEEVGY